MTAHVLTCEDCEGQLFEKLNEPGDVYHCLRCDRIFELVQETEGGE